MASFQEQLDEKLKQQAGILSSGKQQALGDIEKRKQAAQAIISEYEQGKKPASTTVTESKPNLVGSGSYKFGAGDQTTTSRVIPAEELAKAQRDIEAANRDLSYVNTGAWDKEITGRFETELTALKSAAAQEAAQNTKRVIKDQMGVADAYKQQIAGEKSILAAPEAIKFQAIEAAKMGDIAQMTPAQIEEISKLTPAEIEEISRLDPTMIEKIRDIKAAKLDIEKQDQFRQGQLSLVSQLQAQAAGQGPSLAEAQLKAATNRNLAQQLAAVGSIRGGNVGLQSRQIQAQSAAAAQELATQSAMARMQEQAKAREQLAAALQAGRVSDIDIAKKQAEMEQEAEVYNIRDARTAALEQAKLIQEAGKENLITERDRKLQAARFAQETGVENLRTERDVNLARAKFAQEAGLENVKTSRDTALEAFKADNAARIANLAAKTDIDKTNVVNAMDFNRLQLQEDQFKKGRLDYYTNLGMNLAQAAEQTALDWGKFNETMGAQYAGYANQKDIAMSQIAAQKEMAQNQLEFQKGQASDQLTQGYILGGIGAAGSIASAAAGAPKTKSLKTDSDSDKRVKKDIQPASKDIKDFLGALEASKYKYKEPEKTGRGQGEFVSVMAQELEKTKLGKSMVGKDAEGVKNVDYGKGFGAILAAQVELNKRLNELESKKRK